MEEDNLNNKHQEPSAKEVMEVLKPKDFQLEDAKQMNCAELTSVPALCSEKSLHNDAIASDELKLEKKEEINQTQCGTAVFAPDNQSTDICQIDTNLPENISSLDATEDISGKHREEKDDNVSQSSSEHQEEINVVTDNTVELKHEEPVFDGTDPSEVKITETLSDTVLFRDSDQEPAWPDKALAFKNFVKEKSAVAVSSVFRRLSGKNDEAEGPTDLKETEHSLKGSDKDAHDSEVQKMEEKPWNVLSFIKIMRDTDAKSKTAQTEITSEHDFAQGMPIKDRAALYTRIGCQDCREFRSFLRGGGIKFTEINLDIYPHRKVELEKSTGSLNVPKLFINNQLIGGLNELKEMGSGKFTEKVKDLLNEEPKIGPLLQMVPGEDDPAGNGVIDELAFVVKRMKESVVVKDRFYKMRRFGSCFLGSDAVDFLAKDQHLEREEAIEFGRKLAEHHFFHHVLDEIAFEDGTHVYRFLDNDPVNVDQCYNITRGILETVPRPIAEIHSSLRLLLLGIVEAYVSDDGRHVDYRSIHESEEFARCVRLAEELQRVDVQGLPREEKLALFINLYNLMIIHAILIFGYPAGPLARRKFFGDFKYVIGGATYSLSAIQNGILRGNQRPPYALVKPFGASDRRAQVALPYPEPLVHFALATGNQSAPALRCYSPANIDKELMQAACDFLKNGNISIDRETKIVYVNKILRWYSTDFGNNEVEMLKHVSNFLEASDAEELLTLLASGQMKVVGQPYNWEINL